MTSPNGRARNNGLGVTRTNPCPICKHSDYCSVTADGTLAKCMCAEAGAVEDKNRQERHPVLSPPPRQRRPARSGTAPTSARTRNPSRPLRLL